MTAGIINSGLSGLFANQVQLETASHNLANATVDGYHRQRVVLATEESLPRGSFFIGRGVQVQTVQRVFDRFVEKQVQEAKSEEAYLDILQQQVNQVANLLQDGGDALNSSMQAFFGAFSGLAGSPGSQPQRQLVLATGSALSGAFGTLQRRLDIIRDSLDNGITQAVTQLEDAATNLARINVLIVEQGQTSTTGPSPDILDSRDRLISRIGTIVNASTVIQEDGTASVQIADGRTLVEGGRASRVTAEPSETSPADLTMYLEIGGVKARINERTVTKGTLGGLFEMRRETLDYTESQLGRMVLSMAAEINELHKSGFDLDSQAGGDLFIFDENQSNSTAETILTSSQLFSTSTTFSPTVGRKVQPSTSNDGTANIRYTIPADIDSATSSIATQLQSVRSLTGDSYSIVYRDSGTGGSSASDYTVTSLFGGRQVTNLTVSNSGSGAVVEFEGLRLLVDNRGSLVSGDAFEVRPTAGFAGLVKMALSDPREVAAAQDAPGGVIRAGDGRNAQAIADLQRAGVIGSTDTTAASTFTEAFSEIAGTVGVQAESAKLRGNAQTALVRQLVDQQQSVSGVNLDEEAASLLRFQQAYQASAKLIAIAGTLLQSILEI